MLEPLTVETYFVNIAVSHDLIVFSPSDSMAKLIVDMKSAYGKHVRTSVQIFVVACSLVYIETKHLVA